MNNNGILNEILDQITQDSQDLTDYRMQLALKIYEGMKSKGWNQSVFATEMGKKDSVISRWLSGTHNFESDTLFYIEKKLGISLLFIDKKIVAPIYVFPTSGNITVNFFKEMDDYSKLIEGQIDLKDLSTNSGMQVLQQISEESN